MFEWHKYLCEYYNVTPERALELGTRSNGRKPDLPGSSTCNAVSEKTFEDIWQQAPRKTITEIFNFYKDQGSWSAFRQSVRHKDLESLHLSIFNAAINLGILKEKSHVCEYGCGVAPFITTFLKYCPSVMQMSFTIADVECEHFNFAQYKLNKIKSDRSLKNIDLNFIIINPSELPKFYKPVDVLLCFEVMEHVPSPMDVIVNIDNQMIKNSLYIENFIKSEINETDDGPDLKTAQAERPSYYQFLERNFQLIHPEKQESDLNPNVTRIWKKWSDR